MKLIIGLGNPGKQYEKTRHNAGFMFLDALAVHKEVQDGGVTDFTLVKKFKSEIVDVDRKGERLVLIKPQTYMNSSGEAVAALLNYYKLSPEDLVVVHDDVDLPVGMLRVRQGGSSAGQKGVQNIIDNIGSEDFIRFRIGITDSEKKDQIDTVDYVLGRFTDRQLPMLNETIGDGVEYLLQHIGNREGIPARTLPVIPK